MADLSPPPQTTQLASDGGTGDPAWIGWFHELWSKARQGFQTIKSQSIELEENIEVLLVGSVSGFKDYKIVFDNVTVSQPDSYMYIQVTNNGGDNYRSGASDYSWITSISSETSSKIYDNADMQIVLTPANLGNGYSNVLTGEMIFYDVAGTSPVKFFRWDIRYKDSDGNIALVRGAGSYNDSTAIDGIKFFVDQGKFAGGELDIFGAK